jgi:hypothetical protein
VGVAAIGGVIELGLESDVGAVGGNREPAWADAVNPALHTSAATINL